MQKGQKLIYGVARSYTKSKAKQYNMKDKDGNVLTEQEDIDNRWREYFDEFLNAGDEQECQETENLEEEEENDEITREEYEWALEKCKNSKTPGVDEIQIELKKLGGELLQQNILKLLNRFYFEGAVPEEWCKTLVIPIFTTHHKTI